MEKEKKSERKFRVGYGVRIRKKLQKTESKQRKKQTCPVCKKLGVKRLSKGIWQCEKCGKKFASDIYYLE